MGAADEHQDCLFPDFFSALLGRMDCLRDSGRHVFARQRSSCVCATAVAGDARAHTHTLLWVVMVVLLYLYLHLNIHYPRAHAHARRWLRQRRGAPPKLSLPE